MRDKCYNIQSHATKMNFVFLISLALLSLTVSFDQLPTGDFGFPEASSRALSDAALFYDEEIEAIVKLVNICKEHENFTKATRQEAVEVLDAVLEAEKKAIEKIEAALATLSRN